MYHMMVFWANLDPLLYDGVLTFSANLRQPPTYFQALSALLNKLISYMTFCLLSPPYDGILTKGVTRTLLREGEGLENGKFL